MRAIVKVQARGRGGDELVPLERRTLPDYLNDLSANTGFFYLLSKLSLSARAVCAALVHKNFDRQTLQTGSKLFILHKYQIKEALRRI
jgi:hypothetical protein